MIVSYTEAIIPYGYKIKKKSLFDIKICCFLMLGNSKAYSQKASAIK